MVCSRGGGSCSVTLDPFGFGNTLVPLASVPRAPSAHLPYLTLYKTIVSQTLRHPLRQRRFIVNFGEYPSPHSGEYRRMLNVEAGHCQRALGLLALSFAVASRCGCTLATTTPNSATGSATHTGGAGTPRRRPRRRCATASKISDYTVSTPTTSGATPPWARS